MPMLRHSAACARDYCLILLFAGLVMTAAPAISYAGERVTLDHGGLTLNANLELAQGKTLADGVVLLTHGTLAHNKMEIIVALQTLLRERGHNSLAINLSLGVNDRASAMYDCATPHTHRESDATAEIAAWIGWLKAHGATGITIAGHSRGGAQTAAYAAAEPDSAVERVVLIAPATWTAESAGAGYENTYKTPLAPLLEKAATLVASGKGSEMLANIGILYCPGTSASAAAFTSYYQADPRHDAPGQLPAIKLPVLVIAGGDDQVVKGLPERVEPLADGQKLRLEVIEGADHFFQDFFAEEAADNIAAFIDATPAAK